MYDRVSAIVLVNLQVAVTEPDELATVISLAQYFPGKILHRKAVIGCSNGCKGPGWAVMQDAFLDVWPKGYPFRDDRAIEDVVDWRYHDLNDKNEFDRCHTIPNAVIVGSALLYREVILNKVFGITLTSGLDTDCYGVAAGSVLVLSLEAVSLRACFG